jgi:hypothetical protein
MGSFRDKTFDPTQKEILAVCDTRKEALRTEMFFHDMYDVARNPVFANKAKATSVGFCTEGTTASEEAREKFRLANAGERNPSYGKVWWMNPDTGEERKSSECPGSEWVRGRGGKAVQNKWWNNPATGEEKKSEKSPGEGWVLGRNREMAKRNTERTGQKWWVNFAGETTHSKECPGPGWQQGRKFKEEN